MKKTIFLNLILLSTLLLGGCSLRNSPDNTTNNGNKPATTRSIPITEPKLNYEESYKVVAGAIGKNLINKLESVQNFTSLNQKTDILLNGQTNMGSGNINLNIDGNFINKNNILKNLGEATINLKGKLYLNYPQVGFDIDFDGKSLFKFINGKIFANLQNFIINSSNPQVQMLSAFVNNVKNKWISLVDLNQIPEMNASQLQMEGDMKEVVAYLKRLNDLPVKNQIFNNKSESKEGDYSVYTLELNKSAVTSLVKDLMNDPYIQAKNKLSPEEIQISIKSLEENLDQTNIQGTLKMKNSQDYILNFTISDKNNKDSLLLNIQKINDNMKIDFTLTSTSENVIIKGNINMQDADNAIITFEVTQNNKKIFGLTANITFKTTDNNIELKVTTNLDGEFGKINLNINQNSSKIPEIKVDEPTNSMKIEEIINSITGGGAPVETGATSEPATMPSVTPETTGAAIPSMTSETSGATIPSVTPEPTVVPAPGNIPNGR